MKDRKFLQLIKNSKTILIIGSDRLDYDCICSGLILKKYLQSLGKDVRFIFPRHVSAPALESFSFLPYFSEVEFVDSRQVLEKQKFDVLIFVDGPNKEMFYDCRETLDNPPDFSLCPVRIVIDHHQAGSDLMGNHIIRDIKASATAEIIMSKIIPEGFIDENIATLGYAAIVDDTGNFSWNFSAETFHLCVLLLTKGAKVLEIVDRIIFSRSKSQLEALAYGINHHEYIEDIKTTFLCLPYQKVQQEEFNSERLRQIKNIYQEQISRRIPEYPRGIVMYESKPDRVHISLRGNNLRNKVNLANVVEKLGGVGGRHFNSCGADVVGNFEEVKKKLIKLIREYLDKQQLIKPMAK